MECPPVLFIVFRRPSTTERVFEVIRQAEPSKLFIAADGPRSDHPDEKRKCEQTRSIVKNIDWECEVHRNYSEDNLGCGRRPATAINWLFKHVDKAIILEDDCLPDPSFFPFCDQVLERYSGVSKVMHINGNTYGLDQSSWHNFSYSFGSYPQAWGWATWRRAWENFDFEISAWPEFRDSGMVKSLDGGSRVANDRINKWNKVHGGGDGDVWDYQWHFAVMNRGGLAVVPQKNLISNIGFSSNATHTKNKESHKHDIERKRIEKPIRHPPFLIPDKRVNKVYRNNMLTPRITYRIARKIKQIKKRFIQASRKM